MVDLEDWTETLPGGEFVAGMRDGTHYSWRAAEPLGEWLAPQVLAAAGDPAGLTYPLPAALVAVVLTCAARTAGNGHRRPSAPAGRWFWRRW